MHLISIQRSSHATRNYHIFINLLIHNFPLPTYGSGHVQLYSPGPVSLHVAREEQSSREPHTEGTK